MCDRLESQVFSHGQKGTFGELKLALQRADFKDICEIIDSILSHKKFYTFFEYLMQGLKEDVEWAHNKRTKTILYILRQLHLPSQEHAETVVWKICAVIKDHPFKNLHLTKLVSFSMELLQKGAKEQIVCWKVVLPFLLDQTKLQNCIELDEEEISGLEYNQKIISNLLNMHWNLEILISIAEMLKDLPLNKADTCKAITKITNNLEKLPPQEVPPLVYHTLALCKQENSQLFFSRLENFFNKHIYDNWDVSLTSADSEFSNTMENIQLVEAESTVLYYIVNKSSEQIRKGYINSLGDFAKTPECVLQPFKLTLLLSLTSIPFYKENIFNVLKASIYRYYAEEERQKNSCWFRENVPEHLKLSDVVKKVINISHYGRELVVDGLVNMAFFLLNSAVGKNVAENNKVSNLAVVIIVSLIKKNREVVPVVLKNFQKSLRYGQNMQKVIECFAMVAAKYGYALLENVPLLVEILKNISTVDESDSKEFLEALMPLLKVASVLREDLILILKEKLFCNDEKSCINAINGYLKMLKYLKLSQSLSLSQRGAQSSCSFSLSTQISLARSGFAMSSVFSNESVCLEVLNTLKRCFILSANVKIALYEGLTDVVKVNRELSSIVLSFLWDHLKAFIEFDPEVLPPLKFSLIYKLQEDCAVLVEPLGSLLNAIALVLSQVKNSQTNSGSIDDNGNMEYYVVGFLDLAEKMSQSDLEHFTLNDGTNLTDILPECQAKRLILQQVLLCYQAFMTFNLETWSLSCENYGKNTKGLFKGHSRLVEFAKNYQKSKKEPKNGNQSKNNTTAALMKAGNQKIKLPPTVFHLKTISRFVSLLYNVNVDWATADEANIIKGNVFLHHFVLESLQSIASNLKNQKYLPKDRQDETYKCLKEISVVFFKRCALRFREMLDFDTQTTLMCMECLNLILQGFVQHFKRKMQQPQMCSTMIGSAEDALNYEEVLLQYQELFDSIENDQDNDSEILKLLNILVASIVLLAEQISTVNRPQFEKTCDWMKKVCMEKTLTTKQIVTPFVTAFFESNEKITAATSKLEMFAKAAGNTIGWITENNTDADLDVRFAIVNPSTSTAVILIICNEIKSMLENLDWLIARIKLEHNYINNLGSQNDGRKYELTNRERNVCRRFQYLIVIMEIINNISVELGPLTEALMKNNVHLFNSLANLAKYFLYVSTKVNVVFQDAGFPDVVKRAVKFLYPVIDKQILYIEQNQQKEPGSSSKKGNRSDAAKVLKSKVLREVRWIPKYVYEFESFKKIVIQITKKTKVDVYKYLGLGTGRDFQILDFKEAAVGVVAAENNDNSEQTLFSSSSDEEEEKDEQVTRESSKEQSSSDEELGPPVSKRRK